MSYLALYRKYRPVNLNDVVGQKYIIKILKNSIKNNKISHAYLFSGPRGTGKTTIAKAFAKAINCENLNDYIPCDACNSCLSFKNSINPDIIEIDAASNNGVDEIRKIRDNVNLLPTVAKYKVYIIDEVHMLSTSAFNALLKTLEEPPKHVVFILATTDFYKVPDTVVSRCQCLEFSRISEDDLINRLSYISEQENIKISNDTIKAISKYSNGGLRDAIGFLDKLSLISDDISITDFYDLMGLATTDLIDNLLDCIINNEMGSVFNIANKCFSSGINISLLINQMYERVKDLIIDEIVNKKGNFSLNKLYDILNVINESLLEIKKSLNYEIVFNVMILKMFKVLNNSNFIINYDVNKENIVIDNKINSLQEDDNKSEDVVNISKENIVDDQLLSDVFYKNKDIIINNALFYANKNDLQDLKLKFSALDDYINNPEFSNIVSFLMDGNLRVYGNGYLVISLKYESSINNADFNLRKIETLVNIIIGRYIKISFVSEEKWEEIRNKFISNKKNGIKYEFMEEIVENNDNSTKNDIENNHGEVYNNAVLLFGDDLVEVK